MTVGMPEGDRLCENCVESLAGCAVHAANAKGAVHAMRSLICCVFFLFHVWKWSHTTCKLCSESICHAVSVAAMLCSKAYNAKCAGMLRILTNSPAVQYDVTVQVMQSS